MSGFTRAYFIGGQGGFMGADGVNPLALEILEGHADRMWFEPLYADARLRPLGALEVTVPNGPSDADALLDACLAFFPEPFEQCPSMPAVRRELGDAKRLDFDAEKAAIPPSWSSLRDEARPLFGELNVWVADLVPLGRGDER